VLSIVGNEKVEGVGVAQATSEKIEPADGVMVAVGLRPRSELAASHAELDASGAIRVAPSLASTAEGLYACGDVREGSAWRYAAAWGDGLTAARSVLHRLVSGTATS
jgi:thioredoxin reductase